MRIILCAILFIVFSIAQMLCIQKVTNKTIKHIPLLVSAIGSAFAIGLHAYALIAYHMGTASESVLVENQYFATFTLIPAGICMVGSIIGTLIAKCSK